MSPFAILLSGSLARKYSGKKRKVSKDLRAVLGSFRAERPNPRSQRPRDHELHTGCRLGSLSASPKLIPQALIVSVGPPVLNHDSVAYHVAGLTQSLSNRIY